MISLSIASVTIIPLLVLAAVILCSASIMLGAVAQFYYQTGPRKNTDIALAVAFAFALAAIGAAFAGGVLL